MKKLKTAALLSSLYMPFTASADIALSTNGLGDAVYVPYFTVEQGQDSLISLSNHSDLPSSVLVNLTESLNGQAVLYFYAFLPAHSTWTAAISSDGAGARLVSSSDVCTVPRIPVDGVTLRSFDYAGRYADGGPTDLGRTRQGAVEAIERGALSGNLASLTNARNCDGLVQAYTEGAESRAGQVVAPTASIEAAVQVVSVAQGLVFNVPSVAITGFAGFGRDDGLGANVPVERFSTPKLATGVTEYAVQTPYGRLLFDANRGPDAISSLFMSEAASGEVHTQPELGADTSWIVSFPTKHAYVAGYPGGVTSGGVAQAPFSNFFGSAGSCETFGARSFQFNGSERLPVGKAVAIEQTLCSEVNKIEFSAEDVGNARVNLAGASYRTIAARKSGTTERVEIKGVPAIGFRLSNFVNGQLQPGVLANYSASYPLRMLPAQATTIAN